MKRIRSEGDLDELLASARLAAVVNAWADRGLFDELADGEPRTTAELSGDDRALRVTARMLVHTGLLVRRGDTWALSPEGAQLREDGVLSSLRDFQRFQNLGQLDQILERGGPIVDEDGESASTKIGAEPDDPQRTRHFQEMLYRRSARSARATARWIDRCVDGEARVLDLGGGHGRYGIELAERGHQTTLFDLPVAVDIAREMHGDDIDYIDGDFFEDDLGGLYDVVLASNIIHGLSADQNRRLFTRVADVLAPGGIFVIKDMFLDEFDAWPPSAVYFGLTMLMYTDGGDSYSFNEASQWFEEAGLEVEEPVIFERYSLAIGRRADQGS